jgi:histidine triad (HIT) family protein
MECAFCKVDGDLIFEDAVSKAFLDHRPLFPGHVLVVPKLHIENLAELPADLVCPFFTTVRRMTHAVEVAMKAEGTFVAINNKVSQSVPHLHVHIVPRRKGDGLKGFFWPRRKYAEGEAESVRDAIRRALAADGTEASHG